MNTIRCLAVWWLCSILIGAALQAASPDLQYAEPRGGQRGAEIEVTLRGNRLWDAEEIIFHQPGITWKDLVHDDKKSGRFCKVKFVVAKDAPLGEHAFRVRTRSGLSYARRFWVSQFPNVIEAKGNNLFETPQEIALNVTVDGTAAPETADYFKFSAKKGQRLSVEVEGLRANSLRNVIGIDPYVAIMDDQRFALVASDDTALLRQDCYVSTIAPKDGTYVVEVRDASYQGRGRYRAHIGSFPRPRAVYPAGGKVGEELEVNLIGDVKGDYKMKVKLPAQPATEFGVYAANAGQLPPSPNRLRVSPFSNVLEDEAHNDSWTSLKSSSGALPLAFNGILQEDGDFDYFRFTAKKGQRFRFRAHAKKINSAVDPVLHIIDAKGKTLGGSDDADGSPDSRYDFRAPADGDYFVRVYDHLKRGGKDFVYRVESEPFAPELVLSMPEFQRNDNQFRKTMDIPRGGRYAALVNLTRRNVRCDGRFEIKGLPAGVKMGIGQLPASVTQFPVVFEAAPNAPIGAALCELWAHSEGIDNKLSSRYSQSLDWVRANPNQTLYYSTTTELLPVAVCEPAPFTIDLIPPDRPLVRDGQGAIKVVAKRREGFTKPIVVRWMWRPPGVSCNGTVTIPQNKNEATFSISANGGAPVRVWKVCAMGEADAGKGMVRSASALTDLKVEEPFVKMKINLTTVQRGGRGEMLVDVESLREFEGEASVKLVGLPAKTAAPETKLKHGQKQMRIPVETQDVAPVGQHKNVFCQLILKSQGKEIRQRSGYGGIVRIDPKPKAAPKPAATVAKKAAPAKPKPAAAAKPLSRLEQLRLEAKKQAAGQ